MFTYMSLCRTTKQNNGLCYNSFEEILKGHLDNIVSPYLLGVTTLPMKEATPVFKVFPEPVCPYLFLKY